VIAILPRRSGERIGGRAAGEFGPAALKFRQRRLFEREQLAAEQAKVSSECNVARAAAASCAPQGPRANTPSVTNGFARSRGRLPIQLPHPQKMTRARPSPSVMPFGPASSSSRGSHIKARQFTQEGVVVISQARSPTSSMTRNRVRRSGLVLPQGQDGRNRNAASLALSSAGVSGKTGRAPRGRSATSRSRVDRAHCAALRSGCGGSIPGQTLAFRKKTERNCAGGGACLTGAGGAGTL